MKSDAKTVISYLKTLPVNRIEAIEKLRNLCLKILAGFEETMEYGMPCYKKNGAVEIAFASQKNYISLYILKHEILKKHQPSLKNLKMGKGCIKYTKPEQIDFQVITKILADAVSSKTKIC